MALLKYGKYIEKLKLTAQAVHMQITMIYIVYMCKYSNSRALLKFQKFCSFALEHCMDMVNDCGGMAGR